MLCGSRRTTVPFCPRTLTNLLSMRMIMPLVGWLGLGFLIRTKSPTVNLTGSGSMGSMGTGTSRGGVGTLGRSGTRCWFLVSPLISSLAKRPINSVCSACNRSNSLQISLASWLMLIQLMMQPQFSRTPVISHGHSAVLMVFFGLLCWCVREKMRIVRIVLRSA
jgi:hypothetical protein